MTTTPEAGMRLDLKVVADTMAEMQRQIETLTGARHSMYDPAVAIARELAAAPVAPAGTDGEVERLAQELDQSPDAIRKAFANLEAKGLIAARAQPPAGSEGERAAVARKLAELKGHRDLEAKIVLNDGSSCPVWRCYLDSADAVLLALAARAQPPVGEGEMGGGDVIATVDASRWDHPTAPQLAYANGWNDRHAHPAEPAAS